jgi:hypothetical protein
MVNFIIAECLLMLSVTNKSFMLNVILLSAIMVNIVAPYNH